MLKPYVLTALLSLNFLTQADESPDACSPSQYTRRASIRHIEGGGVGYNKGYSTLESFIAADPNLWSCTPFLDLRGHIFNDGRVALNTGLGLRSILGSRVYGINSYYDFRNTNHRNYNQVGLGLETLGKLIDVRVNGYLPVGRKVSSPYDIGFNSFSGNSILVKRKFQYAMKGVDGELGFHLGKASDFDFYGALGSYYFKGSEGKGVLGGKVRLSGSFKEYVKLEVSDSFDNVFHNNVQGQLTLSLPFGPKSKPKLKGRTNFANCDMATAITSRMLQPVDRQEIVVVDSNTKVDPASNFVIFVDNQSNSLGTFESPYPTLLQAQTNSNPGDIIYVFPGDGTTTGMDNGITLKNDQKFWGSGASHTLVTNLGTITIPALTTIYPTITSTGDVITLATNNKISCFNIENTSGNGINGTMPGNLYISSTNITTTSVDSGFRGIYININNNQKNYVFIDTIITSGGNEGIRINTNGTSTLNGIVSNSSIKSPDNAAIRFQSNNSSEIQAKCINNFCSDSSWDALSILINDNSIINSIIEKTNFETSNQSGCYIENNSSDPRSVEIYAKNNTFKDNKWGLYISNNRTTKAIVENNKFSTDKTLDIYVYNNLSMCLELNGNNCNSTSSLININPGTFQVAPCNFEDVNTGTFQITGTITNVDSCSSGSECYY